MASRGSPPELMPAALSRGKLSSLNTFSFWSRKLGRRVLLVGPSQFDAALILEFDHTVAAYCERPNHRLDLLPSGSGRYRAVDFWVRRRDGRQSGLLVFEPTRSLSEDVLRRSLLEAKLGWEVWLVTDLVQRRQFLRNLKQLRPYVSCAEDKPVETQQQISGFLSQYREGRWDQIRASTQGATASTFARAMALMYHSGTIKLDVETAPLCSRTWVSLP